jgi:(R)-2-hydroxyacyl-CoA dehydratese activating ATPase
MARFPDQISAIAGQFGMIQGRSPFNLNKSLLGKTMDSAELFYAGLDVGSLSTKAVLVCNDAIVAHCTIPTGANPRLAGEKALEKALAMVDSRNKQAAYIVGTGYGRINLPFADRTITELTCHAKGAHYLYPNVRTVIDIGGQDSKVIRVDSDGNMIDFMMNDKCAAGTGRFLEVMARALEMDLEQFAWCGQQSENPCPISSTCAVFAESEVVGLLAAGRDKGEISAGLHAAVAQRVGNMAKRIGVVREIAFVGGVAKNKGAFKALENFLGIQFTSFSQDPQINGALGAAVLAKELSIGAVKNIC